MTKWSDSRIAILYPEFPGQYSGCLFLKAEYQLEYQYLKESCSGQTGLPRNPLMMEWNSPTNKSYYLKPIFQKDNPPQNIHYNVVHLSRYYDQGYQNR